MSAEAAAIAREAARIIEQRGKSCGPTDHEGRVCMWSAIAIAMGTTYSRLTANEPTFMPINRELRALFPESRYPNLVGMDWNDRDDVDERDVAKVLLQVADRLEVAS